MASKREVIRDTIPAQPAPAPAPSVDPDRAAKIAAAAHWVGQILDTYLETLPAPKGYEVDPTTGHVVRAAHHWKHRAQRGDATQVIDHLENIAADLDRRGERARADIARSYVKSLR